MWRRHRVASLLIFEKIFEKMLTGATLLFIFAVLNIVLYARNIQILWNHCLHVVERP